MINMRVGGYVVPRITCATTVANRAHCQGIREGKNERGSRGGNHLKGWMLVVPNVRGVLVPNISGSMGCDCGPLRRCPARKRPRRSRVLLVDLRNLLSIDGGDTRGGVHERDLSIKCVQSAVSESLERLEAENAQLRDTVAELMLEIQALREALRHPHLKSDPE